METNANINMPVLRNIFYDYSLEIGPIFSSETDWSQGVHTLSQIRRYSETFNANASYESDSMTDADDESFSKSKLLIQRIPAIRVQKKIHALYNHKMPDYIITLQVFLQIHTSIFNKK